MQSLIRAASLGEPLDLDEVPQTGIDPGIVVSNMPEVRCHDPDLSAARRQAERVARLDA